jgi:hypothetical protein
MNSNKRLALSVILSVYLLFASLSAISFVSYIFQIAEARTETFTDSNNNNLKVSIEAPDDWNSGTASAAIHDLNWHAYGLAASNDDLSAFFVIVNLPSLSNIVTPFGKTTFGPTTNLTSLLLQYNVTLNSVHNVSINGQPEHAYYISVTPGQLSHLQSFLPSINRSFDAVLIATKQRGHMYMIAYAADARTMGDFKDTFQNILNSVSFSPGPVMSNLPAQTNH